MSESVGTVTRVTGVLARLDADLDQLAGLSLDPCTDTEVLDAWQRLERLRRRLAPTEHAIIAHVSTRGVAHSHGCRSTAALGTALLRISPADAAARVAAAAALGPRVTLTGQVLEPIYPATATAQAGGDISDQHARVIVSMIEKLPLDIRAEFDRTIETQLLHVARQHHPGVLAAHARDLSHALDQDGQEDEGRRRDRLRGLTLHRRPDGSARLHGELTAECAEHLHTHLDALTRPQTTTTTADTGPGDADTGSGDTDTGSGDTDTGSGDTEAGDSPGGTAGPGDRDRVTTDGSTTGAGGGNTGNTARVVDPRTPTQRRHDALIDMLKLVERAELLPNIGGVSATIILTMDADTYAHTTSHTRGGYPGGTYATPGTGPGTGRARPHTGATGATTATDLDSDLADLDAFPGGDPFATPDGLLDLGDLGLGDQGDVDDLLDLVDLGDLGLELDGPDDMDGLAALAAARRSCATTGHGYTIPARLAKQWAGPEARIIAVLLNTAKGIDAYSSSHRIFTEQQRPTLTARDLGCTFPGCDAPPQWCEAHHITDYQYSHRTCVDNATLLCSFHHRNFQAMGWTCTMTNTRPHWTPPHWLDPTHTPQLNLRQRR